MNRLPERVEAHCPRCNAAFVVSPSGHTKKIQCPNCRRIVALGVTPEPPPGADPTAERFADLETRLTHLEALLEQHLAQKIPTAEASIIAPPAGDSLLCPGQSIRWLQRDAQSWSASDDDPEQTNVLRHNLRAMGSREIVVQAGVDDEIGQRLAARLAAILREAGWKVTGPGATVERRPVHGLVVAAGECPLPKAATAAYMALQAAGFPIASRLDGTLGPTDWILIAGCAAERAG